MIYGLSVITHHVACGAVAAAGTFATSAARFERTSAAPWRCMTTSAPTSETQASRVISATIRECTSAVSAIYLTIDALDCGRSHTAAHRSRARARCIFLISAAAAADFGPILPNSRSAAHYFCLSMSYAISYRTRAVPSFSKDSPSISTVRVGEAPSSLRRATTATGSVAQSIAPVVKLNR